MTIDRRTLRTWSMIGPTGLFGTVMCDLAREDRDLCVVTADLCSFSGLERFKQEFPENLYNVGIAEQNLVGIATGLAREGMHVFAATYASFAVSRAMDQVRVGMGYMSIPVKLVGLTAGLASGILGATHMAIEDIAVMRAIPGITILSPADCLETAKCLCAAATCPTPVYIRLTGNARMPMVYQEDYNYEIGKNIYLRRGKDITILATGSMVSESLQAAQQLEKAGISAEVVDVHTIQPFQNQILDAAMDKKLIVTVEEHNAAGGIGSIAAEHLARSSGSPPLLRIGIQNGYPHAASYSYLLKKCGLTAESIVDRTLSRLEQMEVNYDKYGKI